MGTLETWVVEFNDVFWTYLLIPLVAVAGVWFTLRSKGVQIRLIPEMFRVFRDKPQSGVSPFGAFTISAAARIGTGNIAGVATAITMGGPGAVFWMWVMALVGGASAFVESVLAQLYKVRDAEPGTYRGGPAYYMQKALGMRWLGVVFAVLITLTFGFVLTAVQSNTITVATKGSFGSDASWFNPVLGVVLAGLLALAVFFGVKRLTAVTKVIIPVMAGIYLLTGLVIVLLNLGNVPGILGDIIGGAFGFREVAGGAVGTAILQGVRRGMFSNEAGMGSAPNAAAAAETTHPVKQGLVQTLGVYFDTLVICTMTALVILSANPTLGERGGADVTQAAFTSALGDWAGHLLTLVVFMVAFSSMIGNYYYGESNIQFITRSKSVMSSYRAMVIACAVLGAIGSVPLVWSLADVTMGAMALVNLIAIIPLSAVAFRLLDDYLAQRRQGLDPVFRKDRVPGLRGDVECWGTSDQDATPQERMPVGSL
ncbi:alanine/glycine:cation symporter family protein [Streptomyces sp. C11-1]|uniref:Alanine/glycine:cation symporter family protein n=1 Tax=Streptomyces durocortorensis TaxID=2811104 RepID=A0ABY9VXD9_9ACTN|nr:alanine/glycine:cation symporter family protein [Streptomyces durocortorensis]WNF27607.1 alanine/glycine:cation symporter family protein [Streptomyces durocortorensis]